MCQPGWAGRGHLASYDLECWSWTCHGLVETDYWPSRTSLRSRGRLSPSCDLRPSNELAVLPKGGGWASRIGGEGSHGWRIHKSWLSGAWHLVVQLPVIMPNTEEWKMATIRFMAGSNKRLEYVGFPYARLYLLVLASAFTRGGLSRHQQLRWPRLGRRHSRLDGPVRAH